MFRQPSSTMIVEYERNTQLRIGSESCPDGIDLEISVTSLCPTAAGLYEGVDTHKLGLRSADIQRTDQYPSLGPFDHAQQLCLELVWRAKERYLVSSRTETWLRTAQSCRQSLEWRFAIYRYWRYSCRARTGRRRGGRGDFIAAICRRGVPSLRDARWRLCYRRPFSEPIGAY